MHTAYQAKLNREVNTILSDPEFRDRLAAIGSEPFASSQQEFQSLVASDGQHFGKVVRDAAIQANQ